MKKIEIHILVWGLLKTACGKNTKFCHISDIIIKNIVPL